MPKNNTPVVIIIEDDIELSIALKRLFDDGKRNFYIFHSAEDFLDNGQNIISKNIKSSFEPGCILLDVRLPQMSGMSLLSELTGKNLFSQYPIIFLTGHGDLEMGVTAMKNGAFDFFSKPFRSEQLSSVVENALTESENRQKKLKTIKIIESKISKLTAKENQLMHQIANGLSNKEIACKFENSIRTIELHRARVFDKMNVSSAVELTKQLERLNTLKN